MGEDLGDVIAERRHDRQSIAGPIAILLLAGLLAWMAFVSQSAIGYVLGGLLLTGGVAVLVAGLMRWNDRLTLHARGAVQVRFGRPDVLLYNDIDQLRYEVLPTGGLFGWMLPFPLSLLSLRRGLSFRLRALATPGSRGQIVLNGACKRGWDEIDKIVRVLTARTRARMLRNLRRGEAVVWTPHLLLTPDGLVVLRWRLGPGSASAAKRCIPWSAIRRAEIRHGHMLVRVWGRRWCAVNSRLAAVCPAAWGVFGELLQEHARRGTTDDQTAGH